jgi:glutamate carboxypeptidase
MDDLLAQIAGNQAALLERLQTWSAINSGSRNLAGLKQMANVLWDYFTPLADTGERIALPKITIVDDSGNEQRQAQGELITFAVRPQAPVQVLLVGHMDTVFPADSSFQAPNLESAKLLRGPGVADMKGGILVMHQALAAWEQHPNRDALGWRVVINPDEETGSIASAPWLDKYARRADLGMVYEPALADGTLAGERKGSGNFSLLVTGVAAHAGREFELGRNAIAALADAMTQLHGINAQAAQDFPGLTLNLGRISGGGPLNIVADRAVVHFNVRMADLGQRDWVKSAIDAVVERIDALDGISAKLYGGFTRPPKLNNPQNTLNQWLEEVGEQLHINIAYRATGGCCDGNNLAASGLPNIDTLGVRGGNIHTHDEFMCPESLSERAQMSFLLLEKAARCGRQLGTRA